MIIRLDRFVARSALLTGSEAKRLIKKGLVRVNGKIIKDHSVKVDVSSIITLDSSPLEYRRYVYLMLNKPIGLICTTDINDVDSILSIIDESYLKRKIFPAGRLDKDTTGFCLLTDDGEFAHKMLGPSTHIPKTYAATVDGYLTEDAITQIKNGLILDGKKLFDTRISLISTDPIVYEVVLHEGRYHEVKRIFSAFGSNVTALNRISIGGLMLDKSLSPGEYREMTDDEIELIFKKVDNK